MNPRLCVTDWKRACGKTTRPKSRRIIDRFQHIFSKNTVSPGGVIDQHMGHSAHNFPILQNWTAGHALYNAACFFQQPLVRHLQQQVSAVLAERVQAGDFHRIGLRLLSVHIAENDGGPVVISLFSATGISSPSGACSMVPKMPRSVLAVTEPTV